MKNEHYYSIEFEKDNATIASACDQESITWEELVNDNSLTTPEDLPQGSDVLPACDTCAKQFLRDYSKHRQDNASDAWEGMNL